MNWSSGFFLIEKNDARNENIFWCNEIDLFPIPMKPRLWIPLSMSFNLKEKVRIKKKKEKDNKQTLESFVDLMSLIMSSTSCSTVGIE